MMRHVFYSVSKCQTEISFHKNCEFHMNFFKKKKWNDILMNVYHIMDAMMMMNSKICDSNTHLFPVFNLFFFAAISIYVYVIYGKEANSFWEFFIFFFQF